MALLTKRREELSTKPVNIENRFEPYVMLETIDTGEVIGICVTNQYRSVSINYNLSRQCTAPNEDIAKYGARKDLLPKSYSKERIVPFVTFLAYKMENEKLVEIGHMAYYEMEPDRIYIDNVATSQQYRGKGIATVLIKALYRDAESRGYTSCELDSVSERPALNFYRKHGFKSGGYGQYNNSLITMQKDIHAKKEGRKNLVCPLESLVTETDYYGRDGR